MKPISLGLNIVLLAIVIVLAIKLNNASSGESPLLKVMEKGANDYRNLVSIPSTEKAAADRGNAAADSMMTVSEPFIQKDLAMTYINNFQNDVSVISKHCTVGQYPIKSVFVDKNTLFNLAMLLSKYDSSIGATVYFAKYPSLAAKDDLLRRNNPFDGGKYDNQYTLVIVATKKEGNNVLPLIEKISTFKGDVYDGLYNYHDLCPPNTNCPPPVF